MQLEDKECYTACSRHRWHSFLRHSPPKDFHTGSDKVSPGLSHTFLTSARSRRAVFPSRPRLRWCVNFSSPIERIEVGTFAKYPGPLIFQFHKLLLPGPTIPSTIPNIARSRGYFRGVPPFCDIHHSINGAHGVFSSDLFARRWTVDTDLIQICLVP